MTTTSTVNTQILLKRGNTAVSSTYVGPIGEITLDTDLETLRVHNGLTAGGSVLPSASQSANIALVSGVVGNVAILQSGVASLANVARTGLYSDLVGTPPVATVLNTGNVLYSGNTIQGLTLNQDITISTSGTGFVSMPRLKLPTCGLIEKFNSIEVIVADNTLDAIADYSTGPGHNLNIGNYGLLNGIAHPWAVYRLNSSAATINVNDIIAGAGIPNISTVLFVGTGAYANYFITNQTFITTPPSVNTVVRITRPIVNASLTVTTNSNTDISLVTGTGGRIISNGTIVPYTTNVYDLGTPTRRWKDIWMGGSSVYMLDTVLGTDIQLSATNGNFVVNGATGFNVGQFTFVDNKMLLTDPTRDIIIGTVGATGNIELNRTLHINSATGETSFTVGQDGLTKISTPAIIPLYTAALQLIGTSSGNAQPRTFGGTMLQITGQDNNNARLSIDAFGAGSVASMAARVARGTVNRPTATQANDTMYRIVAQGWGTTHYMANVALIDLVSTQTMSDSAAGGQINFRVVPLNTITDQLVASINGTGLTINRGNLTFSDSTIQSTAWLGTTSATNITGLANVATTGSYVDLTNTPAIVNYISVGTGLTQTGVTGNVGINATGVANVAGTANQITVSDSGSKNYTLSLPQAIAPASTVQFANLTITGNLSVLGTTTSFGSATLVGKILSLANAEPSGSTLSGGGITLGTGAASRSILYDFVNNRWDTDGAGLKTLELTAGNVTITTLNTSGIAHFGTGFTGYDFPGAMVQADANTNGYIQVAAKNHSIGTSASTDYVAYNDNGVDGVNYIDMGINSSTYYDPVYDIMGPGASYLYNNGGNFTIGTQSAGNVIIIHTGGTTSNKERIRISDTGLSTGYAISSTATTGTAPLVIASTTRVANLNVATAGTADVLTTARNINGTSFNGSANITITANAQTLTSTILNPTVVTSSLTAVGTLASLAVTGNITSGNISGTTITFTNHVGTIITANQPNITNVGTLANLTVTNPIQGTVLNGIVSTGSYTNPTWIIEVAGSKINGNVATAVSAYSAVNGVITTGTYADPSWLTSLAGSKITGFVANANVANVAVNGVVTTGTYADPSWITSLSGAKLTGNIIALNGVVTTGTYADPSWLTSLAGSKLSGTVVATNGVITTGTYADPSWLTSLAGSKITGFVANATIATTALSIANGVYTTDTATVTNTMLAGNISNAKLSNSSVVITSSAGIGGGGTLSLGGNLTLTNTGVLSITASAGISANITTGAISLTNNDTGSAQNIFKNIAVAGQTTVSATTNTDTVNLVAGSGMTITTSGKNVTLATTALDQTITTWTPNISYSGGGSSTFSTQTGNYVKTGRMVMVTYILVASASTGVGNATLTGLPFVSQNVPTNQGVLQSGTTTTATVAQIVGFLGANASTVNLFAYTAPSGNSPLTYSTMTATLLGTTFTITGTITYISAA